MPSTWIAIDSLLRELAALRNDARGLHVEDSVAAEVDRLIASATEAVDQTFVRPDSEDVAFAACEAIVEARVRIFALGETAARAQEIVAHGLELRRVSVRLLYRQITADGYAEGVLGERYREGEAGLGIEPSSRPVQGRLDGFAARGDRQIP